MKSSQLWRKIVSKIEKNRFWRKIVSTALDQKEKSIKTPQFGWMEIFFSENSLGPSPGAVVGMTDGTKTQPRDDVINFLGGGKLGG